MSLTQGSRVGRYEIQSLLGAGGMGEVYRAHDEKLGRAVAIKVLPAAFAADTERLARFEREARTLAALNHPNIAAIYEIAESNGVPALILELIEGETLEDRLAVGSRSQAPGCRPKTFSAPDSRLQAPARSVTRADARSRKPEACLSTKPFASPSRSPTLSKRHTNAASCIAISNRRTSS